MVQMTQIFTTIIIFIIGLVIGSFSTVCIYRLPRNESIVFPGSHCPRCSYPIEWHDNIPLISYIILKGKCRSCAEKISLQYPLVEFLTASLYLFLFYFYGLQLRTVVYMVFCSALVIIAFIDLKEKIIPDVISLPLTALGFLSSFVLKNISPLNSLLGILAGGGSLYLIAIAGTYIFRKEAMGGGDIKLSAMVGAFLGWQLALLSLFIGFLLGSVIGIIVLMKTKGEIRDVPFGPFIALGTLIALFFGQGILDWYFLL